MKAKLRSNWQPRWKQHWPEDRQHPVPSEDPTMSSQERMWERMLGRYIDGSRKELRALTKQEMEEQWGPDNMKLKLAARNTLDKLERR